VYSQRIAFLVEDCARSSGVEHALCHQALALSLQQYAASLKTVESMPMGLLFQRNRNEARLATEALRRDWLRYRAAVEAILGFTTDAELSRAYVQQHADAMLDRAETLVAVLVHGQIRAQWWRNLTYSFLQIFGLVLLIVFALIWQGQIVRPVREIARLSRLAGAGDYSGRLDYRSSDEIGELADAFNDANARTQDLIDQLARDQVKAQRAETEAKSLLESAADGILIADPEGRILRMNRETERIFGYSRQELVGRSVQELIPQQLRERHAGYLADFAAQPKPRPMEGQDAVFGLRQDGSQVPLEISLSSIKLDDQMQLIAIVRDVTERMLGEADRQRLLSIVDATPDLVAILTTGLELNYLNPAGRRMLGISAKTLPEHGLLYEWLSPSARKLLWQVGLPTALSTGTWKGDLELQDAHGREIPVVLLMIAHLDEQGRPTHVSVMARDISERRRYEADLIHRATHDQLTGLANRVVFRDRLEQAVHHAGRTGRQVALLFIDLDDFKQVNDTMGHAAGDILLCEIAERLKSSLRKGDTRVRFGGDEFAVILENIVDAGDVVEVVENLVEKLHQPMRLNGHELVVTTSIGISLYPGDASDIEELLLHADTAMYSAKAEGRNSYRLYQSLAGEETGPADRAED
jgi:diguanylate cyclase (GGDEF)-like protein/PAS domain S-box-containing protein